MEQNLFFFNRQTEEKLCFLRPGFAFEAFFEYIKCLITNVCSVSRKAFPKRNG